MDWSVDTLKTASGASGIPLPEEFFIDDDNEEDEDRLQTLAEEDTEEEEEEEEEEYLDETEVVNRLKCLMVFVFIHSVVVIIIYFKSFTRLTFFLKHFSRLRTAFISERMVISLSCQSRMTRRCASWD